MPTHHPPARPAATLILTRDAPSGLEVLLLRRSPRADFIGGFHVFPGGAVDAADAADTTQAICPPGSSDELLAFKVCAIRECFEEAGLLLASDAAGRVPRFSDDAEADRYEDWRRRLNAGETSLASLCAAEGLRLATDQLAYFSHWIAPLGAPKRFDTRYFVTRAPEAQAPSHDAAETVAHEWITPAAALDRYRRQAMELAYPTFKTLEALACFDRVADLLVHASQPRPIPPLQVRLARGRDGVRPIGPDDYPYAEIGRLDPTGQMTASYEIVPGATVVLAPQVRRITAGNASFMTGPGTNTYLLDTGEGIAAIDPGPADPLHVEVLLEAAAGGLRWVLTTHTHPDHSPAAALLKAATGAELWGLPPPPDRLQDATYRPDRVLAHGEVLFSGPSRLRVLHTPGHASNHLCYLLESERMLFAGDHLMQGSTVVIAPPDGDMSAYMESLRMLLAEDIAVIAPAHGFLMDRPRDVVERILRHRLDRENRVCNALSELGAASLDMLLPMAYADVPVQIHRLARRSLLAHLQKLAREGRAIEAAGCWQAV